MATKKPQAPRSTAAQEAEIVRLSDIIRLAHEALVELRRGDALRILRRAFPNEHAKSTESMRGDEPA